ncbi:MAG: hypothetical protein D6759_11895 [Chloroflexi bacterium]|nr:MAG: hypothetical protein D6759_11895 [Chloroflexota bacterium]
MSTRQVTIQSDLVERIREFAQEKQISVEEFVNQAIQDQLERLADQKLEAEGRAFVAMHQQLVKQYLGQFVAIHRGRVVDADADFAALLLRVQERFGEAPVLIRRVSTAPVLELRAPSPRLEQIEQ